jgi:hypothetical protein
MATLSKTNFEKVQEFNRAFDMVSKEPTNYSSVEIDELGNGVINPFKYSRPQLILDEPKLIRLRLDLIKEELEELHTAIKENNYIEIRDALSDILYVVYGMGDVLGINMDILLRTLICMPIPNKFLKRYLELSEIYTNNQQVKHTNWNWVQLYMDLFPSTFYTGLLDISPESFSNIEREKLVAEMVRIFTYMEELCQVDEDISSNLLETIGVNLAKLITLDYTYSYLMDIDADADFAIVHSSNMSKLCDTEADAQVTVADYEAKFQAGKSPYDSPYYYALPELGKWIVKNKSTGKALKNIKYQKVVFC